MCTDRGTREEESRPAVVVLCVKVFNPEPNLTEVRLFEPPLVTCP